MEKLKQLRYNIICNLFSPCILLNSAGVWKTNMWYNQGIFKDFHYHSHYHSHFHDHSHKKQCHKSQVRFLWLWYYWIFEYFRKKQVLSHGGQAKTFDRFCRITTAYLGRRSFNLFDRQKKIIKWFVGENGYSGICLITLPLQMWLQHLRKWM